MGNNDGVTDVAEGRVGTDGGGGQKTTDSE